MKAKEERMYRVKLTCPTLDVQGTGRIPARNRDAAWRLALNVFFHKCPQVLERGLTVGGSVALAR